MHTFAYDFHIHSALSPCADEDMTPNNIVNMAKLKGLDVIAVTDHNTLGNVGAVVKCAKKAGIMAFAGVEVESSEEAHFICLFKDINSAMEFDKIISAALPNIKNRPDIFGNQLLFDEFDNIIGTDDRLLVTALSCSINVICEHVKKLGGVIFPAHVDKTAFSVISNLGFIPDDLHFKSVEIKREEGREDFVNKHFLQKYRHLKNSDAHFLGEISERENFLHVLGTDTTEILDIL